MCEFAAPLTAGTAVGPGRGDPQQADTCGCASEEEQHCSTDDQACCCVSSTPCQLHPAAAALREESRKAVWLSRFDPNFLCGLSAVFEIQIFQSVWGLNGVGTSWAQSSFTLHPNGTGSKLAIVSLYLSWHTSCNAFYSQCKLEAFHWGAFHSHSLLLANRQQVMLLETVIFPVPFDIYSACTLQSPQAGQRTNLDLTLIAIWQVQANVQTVWVVPDAGTASC